MGMKQSHHNTTTCAEEHVQRQQPDWTNFLIFALPQQKFELQSQFHCSSPTMLCSLIQGKMLMMEKAVFHYTSGCLFQIWPSGLNVWLTWNFGWEQRSFRALQIWCILTWQLDRRRMNWEQQRPPCEECVPVPCLQFVPESYWHLQTLSLNEVLQFYLG